MHHRSIDRRLFLKESLRWGTRAALFSLLPALVSERNAMASHDEAEILTDIHKLTLRELADKRIHHRNGRFINPFAPKRHGSLWQVLGWKLFSKNHFQEFYEEERVRPVHIDWGPVKSHKGLSVTFLKHASVLIKDVDSYLLVDPMLYDLFWIKDFSPLAFDLHEIPEPDHILITHGHYDHLDKKSLQFFKKDSHVISPLGYDSIFEGLDMNNRSTLDWFDRVQDRGREIILLPCNHWTMRNPLIGPNDSLWGSFLIKGASGYTIFVSGDAATFDRFGELGEEFSIDLAIFNLGAYEPRWFMAKSHMNPEETVKAFRELNAKRILVVHWGTFRLGDEPVHFPAVDIEQEMKRQGLLDRLIHMDHGQTLFYDSSGRVDRV